MINKIKGLIPKTKKEIMIFSTGIISAYASVALYKTLGDACLSCWGN